MSAVKPLAETPEIAELLPRDESAKLDGSKLKIVRDLSRGPGRVAITDGERTAIYSPFPPPEYGQSLGFVEPLEAEPRNVRHYTETGMYGAANCVALTDGKHKALFLPLACRSPWSGSSAGAVGSGIHQRGTSIREPASSCQRNDARRAIRTFPLWSQTRRRAVAGAVSIGRQSI